MFTDPSGVDMITWNVLDQLQAMHGHSSMTSWYTDARNLSPTAIPRKVVMARRKNQSRVVNHSG